MDQREYEFTSRDNQLLDEVSGRMRLFAYLLVASVILTVILTGYSLISMGITAGGLAGGMGMMLISAGISLVIAFLTLSASGAIAAAARNPGNEVSPMMNALNSLKKLFGFQYWLIITMILLMILAFFLMFVAVFTVR